MKGRNFWKERRVLITGADGFIGSWLAKELVQKNAEVIALAKPDSRMDYLSLQGIKEKLRIVEGDIADFSALNRIMGEYDVENCFHLASLSIVEKSKSEPLTTFEVNIGGTWNVLEAARINDVEGIVVASTIRAYERKEKTFLEESDPLLGASPYDASKACADIITRAYFHTYGLASAVTRCANTFGGCDLNFSRVIPLAISSVLHGKNPAIRGDGSIERDFLYVKDAVNAYLTLGENLNRKGVKGRAFNFGTGKLTSIKGLIRKIIEISGNGNLKIRFIKGGYGAEQKKQGVSIENAGKLLNWKPKYTLDESLEETVQWYAQYFKG